MSNRAVRRAIQSLRAQILAHQIKIDDEQLKTIADGGLIAHWQGEIESFIQRLRRLEERLAHRRRRGRS